MYKCVPYISQYLSKQVATLQMEVAYIFIFEQCEGEKSSGVKSKIFEKNEKQDWNDFSVLRCRRNWILKILQIN